MKYVAVLFLLLMVAVAVAQQAPIVKIVKTFSEGMTPGAGFWTNNPERIIVSENMMVTSIGNRTKRFGLRAETTYPPICDAGITSLMEFVPQFDSTALLYTAGGKWFYQKTGLINRRTDPGGGSYWTIDPGNDTTIEIVPWNGGTSISLYHNADTVIGIGTHWIRDLQVGDSITAANETRAIRFVISDTRIQLTDKFQQGADSLGVTVWSFQRTHSALGTYPVRPWMHQYRDNVFTGTLIDPPQVIYATDTNMYIKPLGIIDSMTVDKLYNTFIDSILGSSWDSTTGSGIDTQIFFIQLVDRSKSWTPMEYATGDDGESMTYYFHWGLDGPADDTAFWQHTFEILSNSDTSLLLKAGYVNDSLNNGGKHQGLEGRARLLKDTLTNDQVTGSKGYIFCATGIVTEVFSEEQCGEATIYGAGAVWSTTSLGGSPAVVDTVNQHQFQYGNYYIEVLEEISIPVTRAPSWNPPLKTILRLANSGPPPVDTVNGAQVVYSYAGDTVICNLVRFVGEAGKNNLRRECVVWRRWWVEQGTTIRNVSLLGKLFHIDMSYWQGDSLHFVTSNMELVDALDGNLPPITITKWRIVKSGMPKWSGMTTFHQQLMGWGDTSAVGMINFSHPLEPFRWTPVGDLGEPYDVFLSGNPSDPIVSVYPFDDKAFIFRRQSMLAYDGVSFTEISNTDGLASPTGVVAEGKFLYWIDIDGVKRMQRRDFSGYSITKISSELDPIFNSWDDQAFGYQRVPYGISATLRDQTVLSYNRQDRHLYLFFANRAIHADRPETSELSLLNNKALTYNIDLKIWDGVQTIPASAAIFATQRDVAKIFIGSPDSAFISSIDYSTFADYDTLETQTILRSAGFYTADQWGMPVKSRLEKAIILLKTRGTDSLHITFRPLDIDARDLAGGGDNSYILRDPDDEFTEPLYLWKPMGSQPSSSVHLKDGVMYTVYPDSSNIGSHWNWEIRQWSNDQVSIFEVMKMWMKFVPVEDY